MSEAGEGPADVHANQDAADIKDDGAELAGCHGLFSPGRRQADGASGANNADDGRQDGKHDNHGDDVMNALANIRN